LSAFFSSSETAFISLQKIRLDYLVKSKVKGAKRVARLIQRPERLLSIVLLSNTFVNTAAAALATAIAINQWPNHGILIATVGLTIILLIFCETTPKTIAAMHGERLSLTFARPLEVVSWVLTPFVIALSCEVMVPRPEVICIELGSKVADFHTLYAENPLSRFPVFKENMDNVVGILAIKDVLMAQAKGSINRQSVIDGLIRPAYFTPETNRISELFAEMRDRNYRMAVVIDEFGGTAGIVSLTRLVEEVVGPVGDELAAVEKDYEVINAYTFQVDGGMRIEEANEQLELELPEGDYETVAGFILDLLGRIPKPNEQLRYKDLKLVITEMRGVKIEKILLTKENPTASDQQGQ